MYLETSKEEYLEKYREKIRNEGPDKLREDLKYGRIRNTNRAKFEAAERALEEYDQEHGSEARGEQREKEALTIAREANDISRSARWPA